MAETGWKIGELAKKTGVTVRTLHHYDRIGLFSPSRYTESGHRVYSAEDLNRLQQIVAMKQLGLSLEEIGNLLDNPAYDPVAMLDVQLARYDEQIDTLIGLRDKVSEIRELLRAGKEVSVEQFLIVLQMMKIMESGHFSPGQVEAWKQRRADWAKDGFPQGDGRQLLEEFRVCLENGRTPNDPAVLRLARRWKKEMEGLVREDEPFVRSLEHYYRDHPEQGLAYGMDGELYTYIKEATNHVRPPSGPEE